MRTWLAVLLLATVKAATAEKLGDIEVITRDELGQGGLVPPTKISTLVPVTAQPPPPFIQDDDPPPPLSYLPPVQTPLPIEPTPAPQAVTPDTLYVAPDQVPPVVHTTVSPPIGLYDPPTQEATAGGDNIPVGVGVVTDTGDGAGDSYSGYDNTYVEGHVGYAEEDVEGDDFGTNIKDSKSALFGGVIGAKIAIAEGFKNAKDSIVSGITRSIAAKSAAFSGLKGYGGHYHGHEEDNYGGSSEGDVVGVGGGTGQVITGRPTYPYTPAPVTQYPIYPPYPQPVYPKPVYPVPVYPKPVYPLPVYTYRPSYRPKPNPLVGLKAKIAGLVEAKKEALASAVAKAEALKATVKDKIAGVFTKGLPAPTYPTYYPTYYPTRPTYPTYPTTHREFKTKAFGKLKTPFYGFRPLFGHSYGHSYGRRPW
ncbi:uncharacterized protein [Panulirus ornatus]|uniref:uncharacterized protein isoform X2 n=1 Tax=Panulirus ornatus TaxID=150431 RepID=UPI003A872345